MYSRSLLIISLGLALPAAGKDRTPPFQWRTQLLQAEKLVQQKTFPRARLLLKQACRASLRQEQWTGTYEALLLYRKMGDTPPAYAIRFLNKAAAIVIKSGHSDGCLLLGDLGLTLKQTRTALRLYRAGYKQSRPQGRFFAAAAALEGMIRCGERSRGMEEAVQLARTARSLGWPEETLSAAEVMQNAGVKGAARHWLNQAAALARKQNNRAALKRAIRLLAKAGAEQDAAAWKKRMQGSSP